MNRPGPHLEPLLHRLTETPSEFLNEPVIGGAGAIHVGAVINDVLKLHGMRAPFEVVARFIGRVPSVDRNRLSLALIAAWLLADEWFIHARLPQSDLVAVLDGAIAELATSAKARQFVEDPDRREELARLVLARLDFRPDGETVAQATDRLTSISGTERRRLLEASRAAEERAREIRAALARKAAEESADKWSRE